MSLVDDAQQKAMREIAQRLQQGEVVYVPVGEVRYELFYLRVNNVFGFEFRSLTCCYDTCEQMLIGLALELANQGKWST